MRKTISAVIMIVLLLSSAGCYDYKELDDSAYVLSIGVDKGAVSKYRFTFQMPYLISEGGEYGVPLFRSISVEADTLEQAAREANISDARTMSFLHLNFFVIDMSLINSADMPALLADACSMGALRTDALFAASDCTAEKFLVGLENEEYSNLERLQENMIEESAASGAIPYTSVGEAYEKLTDKTEGGFLIALATFPPASRSGGLGSDLKGSVAVSKEFTFSVLSAAETKYALLLCGADVSILCSTDAISAYIEVSSIKTQISSNGVDISIRLSGRTAEKMRPETDMAAERKKLSKTIESQLNELTARMQASGIEPFGLTRLYNGKKRAEQAEDYLSRFAASRVRITVELELYETD